MNDKKQNLNNEFDDIFALLEEEETNIKSETTASLEEFKADNFSEINLDNLEANNTSEEIIAENINLSEDLTEDILEEEPSKLSQIKDFSLFLLKYLTTSLSIFAILMIVVNFSAYYQIAQGYFNAEGAAETAQNLKTSVLESKTQEHSENKEVKISMASEETIAELEDKSKVTRNQQFHSMDKLLVETRDEKIDLSLDITPYENRVVIPAMWKNIPLLDVNKKSAKDVKELEQIFMKDLENGIIRYPGSALPWENGNTFIFGHSSNFPWAKWDYNDVFANLDVLKFRDEIIVYYGQKKYVYEVMTKKVIHPGNVKILKRDMWKNEVTLMTCFPVGTTLNRLIVIWSLKEVK